MPNLNTNTIPQPEPTGLKLYLLKTKQILSVILDKFTQSKFYTNKNIFLPVAIAVGLIFFVILLGLIFGNKNGGSQALQTPQPTPTIQSTPEASISGDILTQSQLELNSLKQEINNLDVRQSRLQPPSFDFDIKF